MEDAVRSKLMVLLFLACPAAAARAQNGGARQPGDTTPAGRMVLEQQVRQRIAQVTRERLGATDDQMAKLEATNKKFDEQRRVLVEQERSARIALRKQMQHPDAAQQDQVSALLDQVNSLQRQRIDINGQEQKELSGYLTPLQRAKYFALEQQVRQRMQQMRQAQLQQGGRGGRAGRAARGMPPAEAKKPLD